MNKNIFTQTCLITKGFVGLCIVAIASLLCISCEKLDFNYLDGETTEIRVRVKSFEQIPFNGTSRAAVSVNEVCSRINILVYDSENARILNLSQKAEDSDFGTASFRLQQGTYKLVVLAHSSGGNPTSTDILKINFPNNYGVSDTFLYCEDLVVEEESKSLDLTLNRCVAKVRFVFTDEEIPANVKTMKFKYTGGSSTLDATSGLGNALSTQEEKRNVEDAIIDADGNHIFEIYTFPRLTEENKLKITVSALGEDNGDALFEDVFEDVPVTKNIITQFTGKFFVAPSVSTSMSLQVNADWSDVDEYEFVR